MDGDQKNLSGSGYYLSAVVMTNGVSHMLSPINYSHMREPTFLFYSSLTFLGTRVTIVVRHGGSGGLKGGEGGNEDATSFEKKTGVDIRGRSKVRIATAEDGRPRV